MASNLTYWHETSWKPVPPWCEFFLELGSRFARFKPTHGSLVVAVTVPTRSFASAFSATGVVLEAASKSNGKSDAPQHYKQLADLVEMQGSIPVYIKEGQNKQIAGELTSVRDGHLVVLTGGEHNGWLTHYIPPSRSLAVQVADHSKRLGRGYKIIRGGYDFLSGSLHGLSPVDFARETLLECAIIGVREHMRAEIAETPFCIAGLSNRPFKGCLQDILRVREFLPIGAHYRSRVLSPLLRPSASETKPSAAIFDGGRGFLRCRDAWSGIPWLVVLDRTEPSFDEAVSAINDEHMYRANDAAEFKLPPIPPAIEVMTFEMPD